MKEITLLVPQGIGDILWCYQKYSLHFDRINFVVAVIDSSPLQTRAVPFLRDLPKVGSVDVRQVSKNFYEITLLHGCFSMARIIRQHGEGKTEFHYSCNRPLERGIRIEQIDLAFPVEESPVLSVHEPPCFYGQKPGQYATVYVSGSILKTGLPVWNLDQWADFLGLLNHKIGWDPPFVLLGASYDSEALTKLASAICDLGLNAVVLIDRPAAEAIWWIKNCRFFIGYQSGLNVIADWLDVKQLMLYLPHLEQLQWSWPKRKNIDGCTYNSSLFSSSPGQVIEGLRVNL